MDIFIFELDNWETRKFYVQMRSLHQNDPQGRLEVKF